MQRCMVSVMDENATNEATNLDHEFETEDTGPVLLPRLIPPKYNHQNQVVVKINSTEMASMLGTKSPKELTEMVNQKLLETYAATNEIRIAKVSKGGNIVIQLVDSTEAQKLRVNTNWIRGKG